MSELINNPAFQSGLFPFLVAFITALLLRRLGWFWAGLGFAVAYASSLYLAVGFQMTPLTSTRKIVLLGGVAVVIGLLLDVYPATRRPLPWILAVLGASATLWIIWPVAKRQEGNEFWIMIGPAMAYAGWLVGSYEGLRTKCVAASVGALALGLGTGVAALLGASALLGQLGIAIGAAAGAYVLLLLFSSHVALGSNFTVPVALLSALIGVAGVIYATLPWYSLLPIALIPLIVRIPVGSDLPNFQRILLLGVSTLTLAGIAIAITWRVAGAPPI